MLASAVQQSESPIHIHTVVRCFVAQSCPTLCDPVDCSPQSSSVHGILQARIPEWVAMPSSTRSSRPRDRTHVSCGFCIGRPILCHWHRLESTPLTPVHIYPLFFGFPSQVPTEHRAELLAPHGRFSLVICSIHSRVYRPVPVSQFISPYFPHLVSICLFSASVSVQKVKDKYHILMHICGIWKKTGIDDLIYKGGE